MQLNDKPIEPAEFAALMEPLGPFPGNGAPYLVAIAVSGGADSLSLALLAHQWRPGSVALIVDHGLRPESRIECHVTQTRLNRHGISAHILTIRGIHGETNIQARARRARYEALAAWSREHGVLDLMVAHHAQDQAETLLLRESHGSGMRGLAAMSVSTFGQDIRILRPLLPISAKRLRATLRARGEAWVEDPSNQDSRFERVAIRKRLTATSIEAACQKSRAFGHERATGEKAHVDALATILPHPYGFVNLGEALPSATVLGRVWQGVSGTDWPPAHAVMERLVAQPMSVTHAGVWMFKRSMGKGKIAWYLVREPAAAARAVLASETQGVKSDQIWDNRWRLTACLPEGLQVRCLGVAATRFKTRKYPSRLLAALPAIWDHDTLLAVPSLQVCERPDLRHVGFAAWRGVPVTDASDWPLLLACPP